MKRKISNRLVSILIMCCMVLSTFSFPVFAENTDWSDLVNYCPYNSWAVEIGKKHSIIFLEDNRRETLRWEVVNILYGLCDLEEKETKMFTDVTHSLSETVRKRIITVASNNVINGYQDGTFRPFDKVTRAEFVTMLDRTGILKQDKICNISFSDMSNHWAKSSVEKVASLNVVKGKDDNNFCPEASITPQEILVILDRLVNLGIIEKEQVTSTLTDTFKCKIYGEKEKYIVEEVYSKYDEVKKYHTYAWPYTDTYDALNFEGMATWDDLARMLFIQKEYGGYYSTELKTKEVGLMETLYSKILAANNITLPKEEIKDKGITLRQFIYSLAYYIFTYENSGEENIKSKLSEVDLSYTNLSSMSDKDKVALNDVKKNAPYRGMKNIRVFDDLPCYLPLDAPMTKYMLSFYAYEMAKSYMPFSSSYEKTILNFFGLDNIEAETNISNMPSNYYEYPYIIKGIPKEYYEKPFDLSVSVFTPKICFNTYSNNYSSICNAANEYYNTILNVDYTTINENEFFEKLKENIRNPEYYEQHIKQYVQYVIDNKIVIKGKACCIPGSAFIKIANINNDGGLGYVRVALQFEIVSSNTNQDLLFGDSLDTEIESITYNQKQYSFCEDYRITRGLISRRYAMSVFSVLNPQ